MYSAVEYSAAEFSAVLLCVVQLCSALYCTVEYRIECSSVFSVQYSVWVLLLSSAQLCSALEVKGGEGERAVGAAEAEAVLECDASRGGPGARLLRDEHGLDGQTLDGRVEALEVQDRGHDAVVAAQQTHDAFHSARRAQQVARRALHRRQQDVPRMRPEHSRHRYRLHRVAQRRRGRVTVDVFHLVGPCPQMRVLQTGHHRPRAPIRVR